MASVHAHRPPHVTSCEGLPIGPPDGKRGLLDDDADFFASGKDPHRWERLRQMTRGRVAELDATFHRHLAVSGESVGLLESLVVGAGAPPSVPIRVNRDGTMPRSALNASSHPPDPAASHPSGGGAGHRWRDGLVAASGAEEGNDEHGGDDRVAQLMREVEAIKLATDRMLRHYEAQVPTETFRRCCALLKDRTQDTADDTCRANSPLASAGFGTTSVPRWLDQSSPTREESAVVPPRRNKAPPPPHPMELIGGASANATTRERRDGPPPPCAMRNDTALRIARFRDLLRRTSQYSAVEAQLRFLKASGSRRCASGPEDPPTGRAAGNPLGCASVTVTKALRESIEGVRAMEMSCREVARQQVLAAKAREDELRRKLVAASLPTVTASSIQHKLATAMRQLRVGCGVATTSAGTGSPTATIGSSTAHDLGGLAFARLYASLFTAPSLDFSVVPLPSNPDQFRIAFDDEVTLDDQARRGEGGADVQSASRRRVARAALPVAAGGGSPTARGSRGGRHASSSPTRPSDASVSLRCGVPSSVSSSVALLRHERAALQSELEQVLKRRTPAPSPLVGAAQAGGGGGVGSPTSLSSSKSFKRRGRPTTGGGAASSPDDASPC